MTFQGGIACCDRFRLSRDQDRTRDVQRMVEQRFYTFEHVERVGQLRVAFERRYVAPARMHVIETRVLQRAVKMKLQTSLLGAGGRLHLAQRCLPLGLAPFLGSARRSRSPSAYSKVLAMPV
jgi:hypothetical protein